MADSELGSPVSYSRFLLTRGPPSLVLDGQTDNADHYCSWPPHCGRLVNNITNLMLIASQHTALTKVRADI